MNNTTANKFPPPTLLGQEVGASRWPQPMHSGLAPWKGTVLTLNDKRAWTGTLAFDDPSSDLSQIVVDRHVESLLERGLLKDHVPVLWHFESREMVYWSSARDLVTYEEDVRRWRIAFDAAMLDISSQESPYCLGRADGMGDKAAPAALNDTATWQERIYELGWVAGNNAAQAQTNPHTDAEGWIDFEQTPEMMHTMSVLPAGVFVDAPVRRMHKPLPDSPHRAFYEHLLKGGSIWRNDRANNVREWINLSSLGGDAARIGLYGHRDLGFTVDQEETAIRMHLQANMDELNKHAGGTFSVADCDRARDLGAKHFDFGVRLYQLARQVREEGPGALAARIACARHIFSSGLIDKVANNEFDLAFSFGARDLDRLFDQEGGNHVKAALLVHATWHPTGAIAKAAAACEWTWSSPSAPADETPRRERMQS